MRAVRTVRVTRYVTPLREGGSLPAIVEADDDGMYVLKFRGAGQGARALIAELVSGEIARALGLPVPELVFAELDPDLARTEPDPEIFATRVDNERTRVYSRETGLFTPVDPNLESDVRREAERQVRQAALDNGILRVAAANARTTLTSFLRGLGFEAPEFW
jgi:hypothetical protein